MNLFTNILVTRELAGEKTRADKKNGTAGCSHQEVILIDDSSDEDAAIVISDDDEPRELH